MNAKRILAVLLLAACAPARSPAPQHQEMPPQREAAPPALVARSSPPPAAVAQPVKVDFDTQIRPLLETRCQPCHFAGGKMYARLPFDRPETIRSLGEKLFTRIRNEEEQKLLRSFLAQPAA